MNGMECYDGTRKPPMTTAANQVASGLMLAAPVAKAQPKLMSPGPAACTRQNGYQLAAI
jgi:hypothetical protein